MISRNNIVRISFLLITVPNIFYLIVSPSFLFLGMLIGIFACFRSTFEFKRLFSYIGLWCLLLIQITILFNLIFFSTYSFLDLIGFLVLIICQTIVYIFYQPMFHVILCKIQNR